MALKVWLPLNGNLKNQGLSQFIPKLQGELMSYTAGKIGQCATFANDSSSYFPTVVTIPALELQELTICLWIKPSAFTGTEQMFIREGLGYNGYGWAISTSPSANTFEITMGNVGTTSDFVYTPGQWYHLAVSHGSDHHYRFYINGELYDEYINNVYNISYNETDGYISIGGRTHDGSYPYPFIGSLNDVRIYDEALSLKQIKEISKGLVAHYKLEIPNINTNLAVSNPLVNSGSTSITFDRSTNTYTLVAPVGDSTWGYGVNIGTTKKCIVPYNSYYRFSFEVYVPTEHELVVDYNNYSNDSSVASWNGNDNDLASARLANTKTIPANTWTKCVFGSQNAHASNTSHIDIYEQSKIGLRTASDTESVTWYLRNFKFELDNKATDYVPYGYDPMEFLTTDVSGNGYNGIINGTLSYNADSPRYSGSTNFSAPGYIHYLPSPIHSSTDAFTFTCWFYPTQTANMALYNDRTAVGEGFSVFYLGSAIRFDTGSGAQFTSGTLTNNTWNFISCVYDKNNNIKKVYINGVQAGSTSTIGSLATVGTNASIGNSSTNGAAGAGNQIYGSLSDVRIYATALSADDILTLYKTSGIIDNKGNVYAYEFKEE